LAAHRLENELQRKAGFEFDDDGVFAAANRDDVAVSHLALHLIALPLQVGFDWGVEVCFARRHRAQD